MARRFGIIPQSYLAKLEGMNLREIAIEAAHLHSEGRRGPGTATRVILHYVRTRRTNKEQYLRFERVYCACWMAERAARREGLSARPLDRPIKGVRPRSISHRRLSAHALA